MRWILNIIYTLIFSIIVNTDDYKIYNLNHELIQKIPCLLTPTSLIFFPISNDGRWKSYTQNSEASVDFARLPALFYERNMPRVAHPGLASIYIKLWCILWVSRFISCEYWYWYADQWCPGGFNLAAFGWEKFHAPGSGFYHSLYLCSILVTKHSPGAYP